MQIEVIEKIDSIHELRPQWNALFEKANPGLFMHHSWVYLNYRHFQPDSLLLLTVYGERRKLIGVFPFAIRDFRIKFFHYRALVHGGSEVTDYSHFMVDPDANRRLMIKRVLEKLIELQPSKWDFFKIGNMSDGDDTSKLFRHMTLRMLYAGDTATDITPVIAFSHQYEEAKKISNVVRRFRKIEDGCEIRHLIGKEITDQTMAEFSKIHRNAYPNSGFDTAAAQAYYKALIKDSEFSEHVCLSCIMHEGRMIAGHFGFREKGVIYYYVPGYDNSFSKYGPGQYLLWNMINKAKADKALEFDLLRGSEDYKFNWTNKINTNYTVFGVTHNDSYYKKALVNLWLFTKTLPFFRQSIQK